MSETRASTNTSADAYDEGNEAKASFDDVYLAPTPHAYIAAMSKHEYEIGEQARRYCVAAAELLREKSADAWPVQMLDLGCSYGIGAAFVRYGCSFDEFVSFFGSRAPTDYAECCQATRNWLSVTPPACDVRCVGLDSSAPAVKFAIDAGLLDGAIARDFEEPNDSPHRNDIDWIRSCNLLISTGAIGYVTERTTDLILEHLGKDQPTTHGPFAVATILRMFDVKPIEASFRRHGYGFEVVPDLLLPQRRFADAEERSSVLGVLHERGIDTRGKEDTGKHFAQLVLAAPPAQLGELVDEMARVKRDY